MPRLLDELATMLVLADAAETDCDDEVEVAIELVIDNRDVVSVVEVTPSEVEVDCKIAVEDEICDEAVCEEKDDDDNDMRRALVVEGMACVSEEGVRVVDTGASVLREESRVVSGVVSRLVGNEVDVDAAFV